MNVELPKAGTALSDVRWYRFFVRVAAAIQYSTATYSEDATIKAGGYYEVDCTSGAVAITLSPSILTGFQQVTIKKIDSTANAVTITSSTGTIDGAASLSWSTQWKSYTLTPSPSSSGNWAII